VRALEVGLVADRPARAHRSALRAGLAVAQCRPADAPWPPRPGQFEAEPGSGRSWSVWDPQL